ncbi:hypothetical protein Q2K19_25595 [Micromonospora soli]|uniref:hypothetical protein n=1 Tax=Micromonospora sp. NBRC 110009 TaxID=3061627 RepID=UPI0026732743|nr:hypothetical protein [Micromonospora sp. NBRC 110009]WKT97524.1 hypothetical protein Q2K19_25595 [Micromonospora sp. NBRC 110009]
MALFLTDLDPRARVKGSRDGLGAQAVWSATGRPLIGNLTTVTDSLSGFTTLLVGLRLAELASADELDSPTNAFLIWEQMAAYVRHVVHGHRGFFGLQRIAARAAKAGGNGGKVHLSAQPEHQILSNQRTEGLLGNYTAPARVSSLVAPGSPARLTPEAAAFVDAVYLPRLESGWGSDARHLLRELRRERVAFDLGTNEKRQSVASVFSPVMSQQEVDFYRHHLVEGGPGDPTDGRQRRLATLLEARPPESVWPSRPYLVAIAGDAESHGWSDIADLVRRVIACESVLAPASLLFSYLLGRNGAHLDKVVADLRSSWGEHLDSIDPLAVSALPGHDWPRIAEALAGGNYPQLIRTLAERNATVMRERGGALAWLEVTEQEQLRVRFRDEPAGLPTRDEIRDLWWYPYFIPSLVSMLAAIGKGKA